MAEEQAGGMEAPEDGEDSCDPCTLRHQNPSTERILLPYTEELWQWLLLGRESHSLLRIWSMVSFPPPVDSLTSMSILITYLDLVGY